MKLTEITYSRGQTLQLRQFEPVNVHFSAKMELDEKENPHEAYEELKKLVDGEIAIQTEMLTGNSGMMVRRAAKEVIQKQEAEYAPQKAVKAMIARSNSDVPF